MTTRGLRIAAVATAAAILIWLVPEVQAVLLSDDNSPAAQERLHMLWKVLSPVVAVVFLAAGAALFWTGLRTDRGHLRVVAMVAGVLVAIATVPQVVFWAEAEHMVDLGLEGRTYRLLVWSDILLAPAAMLAMLGVALRADPRMTGGRLAFLGLGIAWVAGIPVFEQATHTWILVDLADKHPYWWFILRPLATVAVWLALAASLWRAAWAVDRGHDQDLIGWPDVARGLRMYGDGLAWRISIVFVGMFMLFMAGMARSAGMALLVGGVVAVGTVVTGVVMLAGIARYAHQPAGSPGAAPAWLAFAGMLMAAALDLAGAILLVTALGGADRGDSSLGQLQEISRTSDKVNHWSLAMGAVSLGSLLLSFGLVAAHLRRPDMVRRVSALVAGMVLSVAAVVGFFFYGPRIRDVGTALILIIGLLVLVLVLVLAFLKLVRSMEAAVEDPSVAMPEARVVDRS